MVRKPDWFVEQCASHNSENAGWLCLPHLAAAVQQ